MPSPIRHPEPTATSTRRAATPRDQERTATTAARPRRALAPPNRACRTTESRAFETSRPTARSSPRALRARACPGSGPSTGCRAARTPASGRQRAPRASPARDDGPLASVGRCTRRSEAPGAEARWPSRARRSSARRPPPTRACGRPMRAPTPSQARRAGRCARSPPSGKARRGWRRMPRVRTRRVRARAGGRSRPAPRR